GARATLKLAAILKCGRSAYGERPRGHARHQARQFDPRRLYPMHILLRGDFAQRLRIGSGLILFAFAATHFLNTATGLVSLDLMHELQQWRWFITRSLLGTFVLLLALGLHVTLALAKLASRAT